MESTVTKLCRGCGQHKALTLEFWGKNAAKTDGFSVKCKPCTAQEARAARIKRGTTNAYSLAWRRANPEKVKSYEAISAERLKERRASDPAYDAQQREKGRLNSEAQRAKNPEKYNDLARAYRKRTPVAILSGRVRSWLDRGLMREMGKDTLEEAKIERERRKQIRHAFWRADEEAIAAHKAHKAAELHAFALSVCVRLEQSMAPIFAIDDPIRKRRQKKGERDRAKQRDPAKYAAGLRATRQRRRARARNAEGKFNAADVLKLFANQKGRCYYCGVALQTTGNAQERFHVDHFLPLVLGGSNNPSNLVLACPMCNNTKSGVPPEEYLLSMGRLL